MHRLMYRQCLMYRHMCLYMTHVSLTDTCLICVICVSVERHILMSHVCHYMSHTCLYITHVSLTYNTCVSHIHRTCIDTLRRALYSMYTCIELQHVWTHTLTYVSLCTCSENVFSEHVCVCIHVCMSMYAYEYMYV